MRAQDPDGRIASLIVGELEAEKAVVQLAEDEAVPAVVAALVSNGVSAGVDPRQQALPGWRATLAQALGRIGDSRAENTLLALLESDDAGERVQAARALGACGHARSIEPLVEALGDPVWQVVANAAVSLGALRAEPAASALEGCLGHEVWWVRVNAADSLALLGNTGLAILNRALLQADRRTREPTVEALALGSPAV